MKLLQSILFTVLFTSLSTLLPAQQINWKALQPSQRHIVNLNVGFDNATTIGIGYGYHFNTKMPLVLNVEYSMPAGKDIFDEMKTKIGGQLNIVHTNNFYTTVKAYGIIRRFENDFARMVNFGSEFSAVAGYYKQKWFTAAEFGFDKAIVTHIKHSDLMKEYNPGLKSGWYLPTGGNFFYGVQGGYSFKNSDVFARVGKTVAQDFKTSSLIPYYFQVGWAVKW
ncbi:MAG TPA: hypothetical protein VF476_04440 [Chitinophagaceae bacterium]